MTTPLPLAALVLLAENLIIFGLALAAGQIAIRAFAKRRVAAPPDPIGRTEILLAATTVILNTAVTLAGLYLYRLGLIRFRTDMGARALLDVLILLLAMDVLMYFLHRVAHHPLFYGLAHFLHHRYERSRPLTLFALHPLETAAFGGLWLAVLCVYTPSLLGMSIYLALNVAFGVIGHLGVEPLPDRVRQLPVLRYIAMAGFHARHHEAQIHNYGFYTLVWDRLFGTLARQDRAPVASPAPAEPGRELGRAAASSDDTSAT